jgi:hypothetical protein
MLLHTIISQSDVFRVSEIHVKQQPKSKSYSPKIITDPKKYLSCIDKSAWKH